MTEQEYKELKKVQESTNKHENKVMCFFNALVDVYKEPFERETNVIPALELSESEITDDFRAIIKALFMFYKNITGDKTMDILGFSHMINRLVFQIIIKGESGE